MDFSKKQYFRLSELADTWGCRVDDLVHHAAHGRITLGIAVFDELLYGVNAELQTVGVYHATGVITIPEECAKRWEKGSDESYLACGFGIDPAYPPALEDASYMAENCLAPTVFRWAPGRTWDNSETDLSLVERLAKGRTDTGLSVLKSNVVIHAVERARIERENAAATPREAARGSGPAVNRKWDKARAWTQETATARYAKGEQQQPGNLAREELHPYIAQNPSEFGLDDAPTVDTVTEWIKEQAPPELRRPGRPRKS